MSKYLCVNINLYRIFFSKARIIFLRFRDEFHLAQTFSTLNFINVYLLCCRLTGIQSMDRYFVIHVSHVVEIYKKIKTYIISIRLISQFLLIFHKYINHFEKFMRNSI